MTKTVSYSPEMHDNRGFSGDTGADTMYSSTQDNNKSDSVPNENTILTSNQTYFADQKIKIPESSHVSHWQLF